MVKILRKIIGPKSKYNREIPYTYEARVDIFSGMSNSPEYVTYSADTICCLIEYLDKNDVRPEEVNLYGIYRETEIPLDNKYCLDAEGRWLRRPAICRSIERHYKATLEYQYKGHKADQPCSFDDRDRKGRGPYA